MIVRLIHVYVVEDSVEAFRKATIENHQASIREQGVLRFDVLQDANDPTHFVLSEVYRSQEATEEHKKTSHYAVWKRDVESMMAAPRKREEYEIVAPRDAGQW